MVADNGHQRTPFALRVMESVDDCCRPTGPSDRRCAACRASPIDIHWAHVGHGAAKCQRITRDVRLLVLPERTRRYRVSPGQCDPGPVDSVHACTKHCGRSSNHPDRSALGPFQKRRTAQGVDGRTASKDRTRHRERRADSTLERGGREPGLGAANTSQCRCGVLQPRLYRGHG